MKLSIIIIYLILMVVVGLCIIASTGCATMPTTPITPRATLTKVVLKTNWIATASIIGIAMSAFAFLNGSKTGIAGMVACFIALTMTLAVARYAQWLAIGGLVGSVGLMLYSMFIKDRALKEVVQGGQEYKEGYKVRVRTLFNDAQTKIQSPQTTKMVKKIKKGLK